MADVEPVIRAAQGPVFVTGSLLRHILVMTGAGAIGLMAIFIGDLANIYFLSRLGDEAIVAAVGYASSILFFSTSIGIGLSIATTSLVAPALGAGRRIRARRLAANAHVLAFAASAVLSTALWLAIGPLLEMLGATGRTLDLATLYLRILHPDASFLVDGHDVGGRSAVGGRCASRHARDVVGSDRQHDPRRHLHPPFRARDRRCRIVLAAGAAGDHGRRLSRRHQCA